MDRRAPRGRVDRDDDQRGTRGTRRITLASVGDGLQAVPFLFLLY